MTNKSILELSKKELNNICYGYPYKKKKFNTLIKHSSFYVDTSDMDLWLISNPFCCPFEKWNEFSKRICRDLDINFTIDKTHCDLVLGLTIDKKYCNLLYTLSFYKDVCDKNLTLSTSESKCLSEYSLLTQEVDCEGLDYNSYRKYSRDYNMSFDIVKSIYQNGGKLEDNSIVTNTGKMDINNISFKRKLSLSDFKKFGVESLPKIDITDYVS